MSLMRSPVRPLASSNEGLKFTPVRPYTEVEETCETPSKRPCFQLKVPNMGSPAPKDKKSNIQSIIADSIEKEIEKFSAQLKQAVQVAVKDCIEKSIDKHLKGPQFDIKKSGSP